MKTRAYGNEEELILEASWNISKECEMELYSPSLNQRSFSFLTDLLEMAFRNQIRKFHFKH